MTAVTVPGFPGIEVICWGLRDGLVQLRCYGWPEDLVASGVATPDMLLLKAHGRPSRDQNGKRFVVTRYWKLRDGEPQHH
jgi:hypothetical protein